MWQSGTRATRVGPGAQGYWQYGVTPEGPDAIGVSVRLTEPATFVALVGIDRFTCTGTAIASLVTGVTGSS